MHEEHAIITQVYAAKDDSSLADDLIRAYLPFIKSEAAKFMKRPCSEQDDEYSIAMIAFYEAIRGYERERGSFLGYAALLIRNRLIDHLRKEVRHNSALSLDLVEGDDESSIGDKLVEPSNPIGDAVQREATQQEIFELTDVLGDFGISLTDVADNCPKQERTLAACREVVQYAIDNPEILEDLLRTKKLPLAKLKGAVAAERKTLERHRKYILALLLIQTNGFEIIRGHLRPMLQMKGGTTR